eukprot:TRINITY_DN11385_c0_g1_i12.p1 TRINITY_DN11385_c0_g1~~TRINITY_DN11385_c0_g1_i12.p1  ORF type:complete len:840 (-),score=149.10 TRINITY_DN11385_c0_g1_i12:395-2914(-)
MAATTAATTTLHLSPSFPTSNCEKEHPPPKTPSASLEFCTNIQELEQIHAQKIKTGLTRGTAIKLITTCTTFATKESLNYAIKVFELFQPEEAEDPSLFMWNSMIRCYNSAGISEEAILLYQKMLVKGIRPDRFTFPFVISACAKIAAASEGSQAHGSLIKMGFGFDPFVLNSLIHFYAECGDMDLARKVFDGMPERNVVSWTSLICGYAHVDCPQEAVSLFWEMIRMDEVQPNSVTMACVVSACARLQDVQLGEQVYAYMCRSGVELNSVLVNTLVDMYMKCGAVERAKQLFHQGEKNMVLCNTMVSNYIRLGLLKEPLNIVDEILQKGLRPDRVTMLAIISGFAQSGDLNSGRECHGYVLRNAFDGWDAISNVIIDMYMKCGKPETASRVFALMFNKTVVSWNTVFAGLIRNGDLDSAWGLFNAMPERNHVSWNTMLGALVQDSWFEEVLALFRKMQSSGLEVDRVTMMSVASACGYLGALDLAKWSHAYIDRSRIPCDIRLGTALVDMYARCGDPTSSMQVFRRMREKDVSAWTAAIGAMAMEGNGKWALEIFAEMIDCGVRPDSVAFAAVLTACSHSGLVEDGQQLFISMQHDYNIAPHIVHYGCMVDLLGRAGLLEEARMLIENMPMEPNDIIWGALLAACRIHNNLELADYAAKGAMELAPDRIGIHVLVSNIYASAGKWADVARVRLHLKERGARKLPGSSSIEVNGVIHEFTSGNESHLQIDHIARMLDEICKKLKHVGHVPDLANVLLDVDEEEKEHLLSRHSEKLAMAFGLISTSPGASIRVIKNLRMCSDCHTFAKLVSEIYSREIVIRDNSRYHFFRQGLCSCMDYW